MAPHVFDLVLDDCFFDSGLDRRSDGLLDSSDVIFHSIAWSAVSVVIGLRDILEVRLMRKCEER